MKRIVLIAVACLAVVSCNRHYVEPPFGGMKGRVQEVKNWHMIPEMWYAGMTGSDIYYINTSTYDDEGNEIYSAILDSTEQIISETENQFQKRYCIRSKYRSKRTGMAVLTITAAKGGTLEYDKIDRGARSKMKVHETSFLNRYKSTVEEDGVQTTVSIIKTNRMGLPKKIVTIDSRTGDKSVEENKFDENGNIIQKLITRNGVPDDTLTYQYFDFDEEGNWKEARTFNFNVLPVEVIVREIKYWP